MRRLLFTLGALMGLFLQPVPAQMADPVSWSFASRAYRGDTLMVEFTATIQKGWKMYALSLPEGGPLPTVFNFEPGRFVPSGPITSNPAPHTAFDAVFQMNIGYYNGTVRFSQRMIPLKQSGTPGSGSSGVSGDIQGTIEYMCCDDQSCVALTKDFRLSVGSSETTSALPAPPRPTATNQTTTLQSLSELPLSGTSTIEAEGAAPSTVSSLPTGSWTITEDGSQAMAPQETGLSASLWGFFLLCFVGGLAGILTPCVFPMIPMIVSFFLNGKQQQGRNILAGLFFSLCIVAIYSSIGLLVSLTQAGPSLGQTLSTHWIPNLLFFGLFILFGLSMLGLFELWLPGNWSNRVDTMARKGGLAGIFFMALTLVIVSFSCTGPIVGAILVESAGSVSAKPLIGMLGFSIAFALPFGLLAVFPSWVGKLPKSGGWMNLLKGTLGFLLLAFSIKFLVTIDQTYHLGILSRHWVLAIWIIVFLLLFLFLTGRILLNITGAGRPGIIRTAAGVLALCTAMYLAAGLSGAPLYFAETLLPPPTTTQSGHTTEGVCGIPRWSESLHFPLGFQGYFDFQEGLSCAQQQNKPVLLVFKGHACANCKKMEASLWPEPEVRQLLNQEFILIALYTDDRTLLPEDEWVQSTYDKKWKKTMGQVNMDFQISQFGTNTQPWHIILSPRGTVLTPPLGYTNHPKVFADFLRSGLEAFRQESL